MSDKKLFGLFSGTHLIIAFAIAVLAPTTLYAVTYTSVVITDPVTGRQSAVDSGRRLYTYDPIAGYANNPANALQLTGNTIGDDQPHIIYTVPAGKAFILKSANMAFFGGVLNSDNTTYFYDKDSAGYHFVVGFDDPNSEGNYSANLGSGWYFHSGESIAYASTDELDANLLTSYSLAGYLVPANAVPAAVMEQAAAQLINHAARKKK